MHLGPRCGQCLHVGGGSCSNLTSKFSFYLLTILQSVSFWILHVLTYLYNGEVSIMQKSVSVQVKMAEPRRYRHIYYHSQRCVWIATRRGADSVSASTQLACARKASALWQVSMSDMALALRDKCKDRVPTQTTKCLTWRPTKKQWQAQVTKQVFGLQEDHGPGS